MRAELASCIACASGTAVAMAASALALATPARADGPMQSAELTQDPPAARAVVGAVMCVASHGAGNHAVTTLWAGTPWIGGTAANSGAIAAWRRDPATQAWTNAGTITSGAGLPGGGFGAAIAYAGLEDGSGFLVVGSPFRQSSSTSGIFRGYAEVIALSDPAGAPGAGNAVELGQGALSQDRFGHAVAATRSGGAWHAVVSMPFRDLSFRDAGEVQVFRRDAATAFTRIAQLRSPTQARDARLGEALAAHGDRVYASHGWEAPRIAVFAFNAGVPAFEGWIDPPAGVDGFATGFGRALACDASVVAVGAPGPRIGEPGVGTVYLFDAAPPHALRATVTSPFPEDCAGFGSALALRDGLLVVGTAEGATELLAGRAAVYRIDPRTGSVSVPRIEVDKGETAFGCSVATDGAAVAIGAPNAGSDAAGKVRVLTPESAPNSPDINGDGRVDGFDIALLLGAYGKSGDARPEDVNGDGTVDDADLAAVLAAWGPVT